MGLKFYSPFINLYLTDYDFVKALSNWDSFLNFDIVEDFGTNKSYPVGISYDGIRIHFMHYSSFAEAKLAWDRRKKRIDPQNMGVMLTNWRGDESVIRDFEKLPFKHKVAFVNKDIPETDCTFFIKGQNSMQNLHRTQLLNGRRYIDQFDYVGFINSLKE